MFLFKKLSPRNQLIPSNALHMAGDEQSNGQAVGEDDGASDGFGAGVGLGALVFVSVVFVLVGFVLVGFVLVVFVLGAFVGALVGVVVTLVLVFFRSRPLEPVAHSPLTMD